MSARQSFPAKIAAVAVVLLALLVGSSSALAGSGSPRAGALRVTKECSEYQGQAGQFCTITSSNIPWIRAGMRVVYEGVPNFTTLMLDTDVVLSAGHGSAADGHVILNLATRSGTVTLDGGRVHSQSSMAAPTSRLMAPVCGTGMGHTASIQTTEPRSACTTSRFPRTLENFRDGVWTCSAPFPRPRPVLLREHVGRVRDGLV